jgi:hypothetical protein
MTGYDYIYNHINNHKEIDRSPRSPFDEDDLVYNYIQNLDKDLEYLTIDNVGIDIKGFITINGDLSNAFGKFKDIMNRTCYIIDDIIIYQKNTDMKIFYYGSINEKKFNKIMTANDLFIIANKFSELIL